MEATARCWWTRGSPEICGCSCESLLVGATWPNQFCWLLVWQIGSPHLVYLVWSGINVKGMLFSTTLFSHLRLIGQTCQAYEPGITTRSHLRPYLLDSTGSRLLSAR